MGSKNLKTPWLSCFVVVAFLHGLPTCKGVTSDSIVIIYNYNNEQDKELVGMLHISISVLYIKMVTFNILLCLMQDDFTCQCGKSGK